MYRMYNPHSGEHFYTANGVERDRLRRAGWRYEGIGWRAPVRSSVPVYRMYNPNAGDHHYTLNRAEVNMLRRAGWRYEGIGWYSSDRNRSYPLYRQYNRRAKSGAHNYTLNRAEVNMLVRAGWRNEGIAWYAVGGGSPAPSSPSRPSRPANKPSRPNVHYKNCKAVWNAIGRPLHRGEPGYSTDLDSDLDGIACETRPKY
ncbi:calcium-binding protein [Bifidobacterium simiarum]|uniref:Calcium-binding protein n=2 Tax=Bifidobacterium simiarum TaxID=2045441 RepID=A0A2M9HHN7_9BIFI|nr:calcium-binding protein [Bifidobacterium simiarum]